MSLTSGTRLGPYEIVGPLGAGGMGEVFRARDTRLGREVAIKVLPESLASDPDRRRRFERETQAVAALQHPNIVSLFDTGMHDGRLFAVMELLSGETLRERLSQGALPVRKAVDYAVQIARGLAAAHDKGLIHRDLKPENIFLLDDGHLKILDFGLARSVAQGVTADETRTAAVTDPGIVMGTVGYMAPEQVRAQAVDPRTDLFALGAVLYEMLSGQRAFQRDTAAETMTAILKDDPTEFGASRTDIAPSLDRIVRHALEKNPTERFQSARDVAFALNALSGSGTVAVPAVTEPSRRGVRTALGLAAAALLLAAGFYGARLLHPAQQVQRTFTPKTFDDVSIGTARFMPDGKTIVYSADSRTFVLREGSVAPQAFGPATARLLAVSKTGELAIATGGALSRMTLDAAPRPVLANIEYADWSPDGNSFAIARRVDQKDQLEYPVGTVLYKTSGYISDIRVSPDGKRVLFMDHPQAGNDRGSVRIAESDGTIATIGGDYSSAVGTVWSHGGSRILFSVTNDHGDHQIYSAAAPSAGANVPLPEPLLSVPGRMVVFDEARDGTLLTAVLTLRASIGVKLRQESSERDMSYLDRVFGPSLSLDGSLMAFTDSRSGPASIFLRHTDQTTVARLGDGGAMGMSPDGRWVSSIMLSASPQKLLLYPTGPGEPIVLPKGGIDAYLGRGTWSPDSRSLTFRATATGKAGPQAFIQSIDGTPPREISCNLNAGSLFSADGRSLVEKLQDGWRLCPINGGAPVELKGVSATDRPVGWTDDGQAVIVATSGIPVRLERVELATGVHRLIREVHPPGLEGVAITIHSVSANGEQFAYAGSKASRTLYVVK